MLKPSVRIEAFRGANVPVHTDRHGNDRVCLWNRSSTKEVMFCDTHAGATALPRQGDGWVPISTLLPMKVSPREGLEDGIVATLDQLMDVFHQGSRVLC